jgi:GT2 family glycosyltransferase
VTELSVIVPVRNGATSLPPLLTSLADQTLARDRFEVIVVDNASTDGSADVAARHGVTVVNEPIANRSRARNRGVAAARTKLYAFTDADCVVRPNWLEALLGCASQAPLVAGEVVLDVSERPNRVERYELLWRFGQGAWVRKQGWAATANLLVHAEAFEAIGGFDPSWRHIGEDADFCWRARDAGYALGYCPEAVVGHRAEWQLRPFFRRFFLHGYSTNQFYYRWGAGYRAWRRLGPLLRADGALLDVGHDPDAFEPEEWRKLARLGRLGYAARMAGSVWAEIRRAR